MSQNISPETCSSATAIDAVLVVPPFAGITRPSLGLHLLQASAKEQGLRVKVFYANLLFAGLIGEDLYSTICITPRPCMLGDRIFSASAFGLPPLGHRVEHALEYLSLCPERHFNALTLEELRGCEEQAASFCRSVAQQISSMRPRVVGLSTTFEQTAASAAILSAVKALDDAPITIIGGANCEGEMAEGIRSLDLKADYIFAGESESVFTEFLANVARGAALPETKIIQGSPCHDLDALPEPDYSDYYSQFKEALPDTEQIPWLPFETSRGCWWGAKHHCTFCGLNGETMAFRQKSPDRVLDSLKRSVTKFSAHYIEMTDNIMPYSYFRTLLPRLAAELPDTYIFYEQKANLSLEDVNLLSRAGIKYIQPGIEALSTSLLRRMDKGVQARQNIALLRYARVLGMKLSWNILYDFPGDDEADYEETLRLVPLLRHLFPPTRTSPLNIDRFSPYFNRPEQYGVTGLRPFEAYNWAFPEHANLTKLAYHFKGTYQSASRRRPDLLNAISDEVNYWRDTWEAKPDALPTLNVTELGDDTYLLIDTRGLDGTDEIQFITGAQAREALVGGSVTKTEKPLWGLKSKVTVELDGCYVPLATTNFETLSEFEKTSHSRRQLTVLS
ncbi:MAG TPA: RiPP maturation radical SAM C-methyltransferase [Pyrinomonadaceae bacterium]|jgi:ribosomal peptide maturation radical SAM protein 1